MSSSAKNEDKIKFFASKPLMVIVLVVAILSYGLFLFVTMYDVSREQLLEEPIYYVIICFFTVGLSTLAIIFCAHRSFLVLEIDKNGIKTSLFHFFKKEFISWEEMTEIRYYGQIFPFVFISKNISLANLSYNSILKQKDVIQVSLTPKLYKTIKRYYSKPIENLSDLKIKELKLDK